MNHIYVLAKRNLKIFLRDRATVFFSFMSTLILIALYFLFIAKTYIGEMDNMSGGLSIGLDENGKNLIVYLQMMAGVLVLNSMSLATGVFSTIARDFETRRSDSFLLTPAKTPELILAYFATGIAVSFGFNTFTWLLTFILIGAITGYWLTAGVFFLALAVLFITSLISCSIMLLVTAVIKSSAAVGVVTGVAGTFFGFLCGIYMPYSNLGEGTKAIGSLFPFSHITVWLKRVVLNDAFSQLSIPEKIRDILYDDFFSAVSLGFCSLKAPLWLMILYSAAFGLICLILSWFFLNRRFKGNAKL